MGATIAELVRARADDDAPALVFGEERWTYRAAVAECRRRAALLQSLRPTDTPFHVGVLLDNTPDFWFLLGACAISGATLVGINPTRRGDELTRDIAHTDCAFLITEINKRELLDDVEIGIDPARRFDVDDRAWTEALEATDEAAAVDAAVEPADRFMLIFTSGTTGAPKAVNISHGKLAGWGSNLAKNFGLGAEAVGYSVMPFFHSNAAVAGYTNLLAVGAAAVLRRRFSASAFVADVREHGVTFFNYVGKPLSYILATPERDDDADIPLQFAFGNEAAPLDIDRFAQRFGCVVVDGYGSTEGGVTMGRTPDAPRASIGRPDEARPAVILNPETGEECPPARFDDGGVILNGAEAIGEMVNPAGAGSFEGYYNNREANEHRMRGGMYWTGDLAYRDEQGWFYFAGRSSDWMRVDGENFAAAPVENVIARDPGVSLVAVYGVPSTDVGDEVMAALVPREGVEFDPDSFAGFLATQRDLSPKWIPRYVRVAGRLPSTHTMKVLKRVLRAEHWDVDDDVWVREGRQNDPVVYRRMTEDDREALRRTFADAGRAHLLGHG